ncbi:hypothetical protein ABEB36_013833 [Hypothenemus hampei]
MHRKSLEAAEQLKETDSAPMSDHEDTTSMRTDTSDTSATSTSQPTTSAMLDNKQEQPLNNVGAATSQSQPPSQSTGYPEDPEVFRNNSIACLRAKAQEHSAKLLSHNLMVHSSDAGRSESGGGGCDANQNTLHHSDGGGSGQEGIF